jgi:hypothetical protein
MPDGSLLEHNRYRVSAVGNEELPDGVSAILLVRSDLSRPDMHNAVLALQNEALDRTWPPTAPNGGDKAHLRR